MRSVGVGVGSNCFIHSGEPIVVFQVSAVAPAALPNAPSAPKKLEDAPSIVMPGILFKAVLANSPTKFLMPFVTVLNTLAPVVTNLVAAPTTNLAPCTNALPPAVAAQAPRDPKVLPSAAPIPGKIKAIAI